MNLDHLVKSEDITESLLNDNAELTLEVARLRSIIRQLLAFIESEEKGTFLDGDGGIETVQTSEKRHRGV